MILLSWEECQQLFMTNNFLESLNFFDRDHISKSKVQKLEKIIMLTAKFQGIEHSSKAAVPLGMWLSALVDYYRVSVTLEPLKKELKVAETTLTNVCTHCMHALFMFICYLIRPRRLLWPCKRTCLRQKQLWRIQSRNTKRVSRKQER